MKNLVLGAMLRTIGLRLAPRQARSERAAFLEAASSLATSTPEQRAITRTERTLHRAIALLIALVSLFAARIATACTSDSDCKGDRICVNALCASRSPAPPTSCTRDTECPGELLCIETTCQPENAPQESVVAQPPAPPPAAEPATEPAAPPEPEMPPGTGGLRVSADQPGELSVDGMWRAALGSDPVLLSGIRVGEHKLEVKFEDGSSSSTDAFVRDGLVSDVHLEVPRSQEFAAHRRGVHFGIRGGPHFMRFGLLEAELRDQINGGGVEAAFVTNFGVHRRVDLRTGVDLRLGGFSDFLNVMLGVPFTAQFNLGRTYSIRIGGSVGVNVGTAVPGGNPLTSFYAAPEVSFTTFRLGPKGEHELALSGGSAFGFGDFNGTLWQPFASLNYTVLFL